MQLPEGTRVGPYVLGVKLGEGAQGSVFEARNKLGRIVALKLLDARRAPMDAQQRLLREAKLAAQLEHPGIVVISDCERIEDPNDRLHDVIYVAMERLKGESLEQRLTAGPLEPALAYELAWQIAEAVAAAHAQNIVHRDLKPANVFLVADTTTVRGQRAKVLDFGLAKQMGAQSIQLTQVATMGGTPLYMSPEQWSAIGNVDHRTDVYALGCILFEMLTGKPPYPPRSEDPRLHFDDVRRGHLEDPVPLLDQSRFHPRVCELVMRMLAKDRSQRVQTMMAVSRVLDSARTSPRPPAPPPQGSLAETMEPDYHETFERRVSAPMSTPAMPRASSPVAGVSGQVAAQSSGQLPPAASAGIPAQASGPLPPSATGSGVPAVSGSALVGQVLAGGTQPPAARQPSHLVRNLLLLVGGAAIATVIVVLVMKRGEESATEAGAGATVTPPPPPPPTTKTEPSSANPWVRIDPPKGPWLLGVDSDTAPAVQRGLRPVRKRFASTAAFDIQQHEVTWGEIESWLEANPTKRFPISELVPSDPKARASYPVTNVPYAVAADYCQSAVDGDLPTEEQWEFAARGPERRRLATDDALDLDRLNVYGGPGAKLVPFGSKRQDKIVRGSITLYDMVGNAQEWTRSGYVGDVPSSDESPTTKFRTVRGLPLTESFQRGVEQWMSLAYRVPACAGTCSKETTSQQAIVNPINATGAGSAAQSPAFPIFAQALAQPDLQKLLANCAATGGPVSAQVTVKVVTTCIDADGDIDEDPPCCIFPNHVSCKDFIATHPVWSFSSVSYDTGTGNACMKRVLDAAVTGRKPAQPVPGEVIPAIKWTKSAKTETFSASISMGLARPADAMAIGFRCVRDAK